ncbi:mitotic checkpoint serine/threonine-protein kinase BUB1 beta isoform X2 [Coregonus clupeaformis]|uniref:mitotic checkpoint serine/threonine-protein kinase BUB1 beta isoform X2 n=1 Tax=Coregonus clupeaformis TaxID=59861 RepID=UPI001BE0F585|nr:mitotic checkpoint serine/threonine-protein kinase BUB1 beta isoform X2 [Coregonus clupeaformis]
MAQVEAERELCKQNIQPLREGCAVTDLHRSHQEGSSHAAIQQQRQAFELELRVYTGDDPLDIWDRYLKWILLTYPQGNKESSLTVILERAVQLFADDKKYYNDPRYINLWIKLAQNSMEPLEMFSYMQAQGIGLTQAALYITWAEEFEKHGNFQKADAKFQEGLKCRAQPMDKLQQYHKVFQARVAHQAMSGIADRAEEEQEPEPARTNMVDLRPRGRKKAVAPVNRTEASAAGHSRGLNLQLPRRSARNIQNNPIPVFNENQAGSLQAAEPNLEPWMAPPTSRAKENEVMPEQLADIKMPQKSWCSGSSVMVPASRPNFQPFVDEGDQTPSVSACKIDPTVNMVLSARPPPSKDESALERLPSQQQEGGGGEVKEQSMYLKELLLNGAVELSIEELRAEHYFTRKRQEIEETIQQQSQAKERLRQQIDEKQRLLQLQQSQQRQQRPQQEVTGTESIQITECGSGSVIPTSQQNAMAFQIFDEGSQSGSTRASGNSIPRQKDVIPDDVFLPPGERGLCFKTPYLFPGGSIPHSERTQLSKNFPERSESLNEDVVSGHKNKTLCASPEDTQDFVKAAKMASSPYHATGQRAVSPNAGTLTKEPGMTPQPDADSEGRKMLSPIQEASLEAWGSMASGPTSTSSVGTNSGGKAVHHLGRLEESHAAPHPEAMEQNSPSIQPVIEDPCSVGVRQRLLDQVDLSSFPNFYSEDGPLPMVEEDDVLILGNETFAIYSKMDCEKFSIYAGRGGGDVAIKLEHNTVPWDFYIGSQLRERLARDSQAPVHDAGRCFLFQDGCVTVHKAPQQSTLRAVAEETFEEVVASLAMQTVELVRLMHSCHLIHGALSPDTLVMNRPHDEPTDEIGAAVALDFSCSVDLELQPEVTAAHSLPAAQDFITQGLLAPSASPYQVDLLGIAETVHTLLKKRTMRLVKEDSAWTLEEYQEAHPSDRSDAFWSKFFRTILNPGDRPSVSVLTELLEDMKKSKFACYGA